MDWSAEVAYCVGLITTDGCLSSDQRHIVFTSKDYELVEHVKRGFARQNRIGRKSRAAGDIKRYHCIQVGSVELYRWLCGLGLTPRKSLTLGALKIPDGFFADFLRGHLDGDGTIMSYHDPVFSNSVRLYVRFNSASQAHLDWLQTTVSRLWSLRGYQATATREFRLNYAKRESIKLLNQMYYSPEVSCLVRKRRSAEPFLKWAEVAELADARVSEARAARHGGSTPPLRSFSEAPNAS